MTPKPANTDDDERGHPLVHRVEPTDGVQVNITTEPDAALALAELLGELAAELWLDGKWDVDVV